MLAHIFYNTTIVIRMVGTAWGSLDPRLDQAARALGASPPRAFWEVTLPLLRPALLGATLLVFLFDFTSFGAVLLLGGPRLRHAGGGDLHPGAADAEPAAGGAAFPDPDGLHPGGNGLVYTPGGAADHPAGAAFPGGEPAPAADHAAEKPVAALLVLFLLALLVSPLAALALRSVTRLDLARDQSGTVQPGLTLELLR